MTEHHTISIGDVYIVVELEELAPDLWTASTVWAGDHYEARAGSRMNAEAALLIALHSEKGQAD
ncbi:MAG: hypothetical protein KDE63_12800 [Novosphingobium sp.]|nr:hypothetical protein [Novosphingobium sp.]